ncbi:MAG: eukaryotic-like serine/threonine-protein kinase [Acidobacteriota bacterium]|jgi:serine/threonine protein kinase/Tol biopolymer transport system component|nr:eukaryotic-like serine/threonine-protein kinase [Acidobacteriota bacterium]
MDAQPGDAWNSRLIGTTVSHYRLLERLAAGVRGGAVFKAQDLELERLVALKLLPAVGREEDRLHLASEAAAASALEHPNICPTYEVGETEDGRLFVAMAFLEGETLAAKIARGPLKTEVAVDLASQVASGLSRAHEHGLVHRNLKPSNVLVTSDGQARILDFGIASLDDRTRITGEDTPAGLLAYRAPEQLRGEPADLRADVWSLGVIFYEMLTGQRPFPGGALANVANTAELIPPSALREGVPAELDRITARALARKRGERYPRADDLRADLRGFLRGSSSKVSVPTFSHWPDQLPPVTMFNVVPREVGPYRVGEILGGGGMGIVYRAEDTRLGRTVALKFLPPELTRDPVAKARFLQEARTASALDHPNICTVYDVGETENHQLYLAMPCYDGETLRRKVERGPLPLAEAVDYALQVSKGLAKAHRQGIIHRDVKPANLMVTGDGVVKILDFGIAKLAGEAGLTRTGSTLGTPAYMSPEQMRGTEVDGRTDLWALGVVMYEMVTGRRPFLGDHESGLRQAILEQEPEPLIRLRPDAPPELVSVIQRLLAKDVASRYPTADAAVADLRPLAGVSSGSLHTQATVAVQPPRRTPWPWYAAAAALLVLAALGGYLLRSGRSEHAAPVQATFTRLTEQDGSETYPSLSPDGNYFVYVKAAESGSDIYLQRVGGGNPINLTPDTPWADTQPAFSADGQQIAFRSEREGGGIFVMGATGESVRRLADFGYNPAWSPDGKQLAVATEGIVEPGIRTSESQLWRISLDTGERHLLVRGDGVQPSWSPNGRRIVYWGLSSEAAERSFWTVPAEGGTAVQVLSDRFLNWNPIWSPDGGRLYFLSDRNGSLNVWRIRIDQDSGRIAGDPEPVTSSSQSIRFLSMSRDGKRVSYATDERRDSLETVAFDPGRLAPGEAIPIPLGAKAVRTVDPSPDGQWLVFDTLAPREDLFLVHPDGSGLRQLTRDEHRDRIPRWSPDGRLILFYSSRSGRYDAWTIAPDGSRTEQITQTSDQQPGYFIWSPDGRQVACSRAGTKLVDLSRPLAERVLQPLPGSNRLDGDFGATSWSPHGLAGVLTRKDGDPLPGIVLYSPGTRRFDRLTDRGESPMWLPGFPVLLYPASGAIRAFDLRTRQDREILTAPAGSAYLFANASRDARHLYLVRRSDEGDVWLIDLD